MRFHISEQIWIINHSVLVENLTIAKKLERFREIIRINLEEVHWVKKTNLGEVIAI